jgi:hypothetical protein
MNLTIPSTHKATIFAETLPHRLAEWQPSNATAAALVCRLNAWPLWSPISESRVSDFRSRSRASFACSVSMLSADMPKIPHEKY